jgi:hypothetical protein
MANLILEVSDEELDFYKKQYVNALDVKNQIEDMFDNKPDGRKKKDLKVWKEKINFLIDIYNTKTQFVSYKKVK